MIDIWTEETMTLPEAAKALSEKLGEPVSWRALYRWASVGAGGVVLETVTAGGSKRTTKKAIAEFCARSAAARATRSGRRAAEPPQEPAPIAPAAELAERMGW